MLLHKVVLVLGSAGLAAAAPLQDMLQVHQTGCTSATTLQAAKSSEGFNSTITTGLEKRGIDEIFYGCSAGTAQWCYFCYHGYFSQVKCNPYHRCTATSNACTWSDQSRIAVCS